MYGIYIYTYIYIFVRMHMYIHICILFVFSFICIYMYVRITPPIHTTPYTLHTTHYTLHTTHYISSIYCLPPYPDRMLCIIVQTRYIQIGCHNGPCVLIQSHLHFVYLSSAILHKPYVVHRIPDTIHSHRVS